MSTPPPTTGGNTSAGNTSGATSTTTTTGSTVNVHTSAHSATGPGNVVFSERTIADSSWPSELILDLSKTNWLEWSRRLTLLADRLYVSGYLDGTLSCPDIALYPAAHHIWNGNDKSLRAFILERITPEEYDIASPFGTANATFDGLRLRHEKLGLHAQINLLRKALDVYYEPGTPMLTTSKELRTLHDRITKMGKIDDDKLFTVLIINSLGRNYAQLQSSIHGMTDEPNFNSAVALKRIETEASLEQRRSELATQTSSIALSASLPKARRGDVVCTNCKRLYHTADFCVRSGGKMAGRTMEEAQTAQRAAAGKPPRAITVTTAQLAKPTTSGKPTTTANIATVTSPPSTTPTTVTTSTASALTFNIEGVSYVLTPSSPAIPSAPSIPHTSNLCVAGQPLQLTDLNQFESFMATVESYDDPSTGGTGGCTFVLDSGATCHISPTRSDFKNFRDIPPQPITGLGGARVYAVGIGTIELNVDQSRCLTLDNVLFVPTSTVRLISVVALSRDQQIFTIFGPNDCWLTDTDGIIIARGVVSSTRNLYTLTSIDTCPSIPHIGFIATRTPNIETWHRRLAHCGVNTIIDMARNGIVSGMPIDLSVLPPLCDHCIVGKQTRRPVPRVREGLKASRRLERVYVDLTGPMHVTSKTGRLYSMNIIDDFSSYVWSISLRSKDEAATAIKIWHRLTENLSGARLKSLVTDNGELLSKSVTDWCHEHGIEHQLTAPYTSAHNGRAERLHRTLMDKARTMRLACNAPTNLWDEFYATAAYLTNLTASSSIKGRTPYEMWFRERPSLSHLREIGCRAYALITTNNPKILQRSVPCVLIGYAPHSKAYRLWNPASGRIFNSYHVTFVEHLDTTPSDYLPGTFVNIGDDVLPPTWDSLPSTITPSSPLPFILTPTPPSLSLEIMSPNTVPNPTPPPPPITPPLPPITPPPPPIAPPVPPITPPPPPDPNPPPPPPPRRSARLASARQRQEELNEQTQALLSEFAPIRDSHCLIHTDLAVATTSLEEVLSAIADGSMEPILDSGDDPSWAEALASPDREYWIAGGREEIQSQS